MGNSSTTRVEVLFPETLFLQAALLDALGHSAWHPAVAAEGHASPLGPESHLPSPSGCFKRPVAFQMVLGASGGPELRCLEPELSPCCLRPTAQSCNCHWPPADLKVVLLICSYPAAGAKSYQGLLQSNSGVSVCCGNGFHTRTVLE